MKIWACILAAVLSSSAAQGEKSESEWLRLNEMKYGEKQVAVGSINVTHLENIRLKPDTAEFSVTYLTEGTTPNAASNQNIKIWTS